MESEPSDIIVSEDTADHLCRIAVESVTAAARQPGCRHVSVKLRIQDADLLLTVSADGDGVASDGSQEKHEVGEMIAYRVRLLGGSAQVEREPGRGSKTSVTVPLSNRA